VLASTFDAFSVFFNLASFPPSPLPSIASPPVFRSRSSGLPPQVQSSGAALFPPRMAGDALLFSRWQTVPRDSLRKNVSCKSTLSLAGLVSFAHRRTFDPRFLYPLPRFAVGSPGIGRAVKLFAVAVCLIHGRPPLPAIFSLLRIRAAPLPRPFNFFFPTWLAFAFWRLHRPPSPLEQVTCMGAPPFFSQARHGILSHCRFDFLPPNQFCLESGKNGR